MKRIAIAVLLVIILLPFTACEEELPPSEEIIDNVVEAMGSVETFRAEGDMEVQLYFMAEEMPSFFPLDIEITGDAGATIDLVNKEIEMTGEIGFVGPDEEPIEMEMAMYLVDGIIYLMYDPPLISPAWMKSALPPEFEDMLTEAEGLLDNFHFGKIECLEVIGEERKEGANCYLLQVDTDLKGIIRLLLQAAQGPFGEIPESEMAELDQINSDITVKIWVDKDDYNIVYLSCDVNIEITPEMMSSYGEEGAFSLNASLNTRYYDYNKKVEITLPPEAENAEDISSW